MSEQEQPKKPKKPKVPRQKMPEQDPIERSHNFYEVALGYTEEQAQKEAERCLQCPNPHCVEGCPVEIDIPAFIKEIKDKNFLAASIKLKEKNSLPAICGRVCPQENQCQVVCVLGKMGDPVAIGRLERFAADYERAKGVTVPAKQKSAVKGKVAIVTGGGGGLALRD